MILDHLSASSLKTYQQCARKFALEKIAQVPRGEETASQKLGKEIHAQIENYFKGGPVPGHGSAYKALTYLPERARVASGNVERPFVAYTSKGVPFVGAIDLLPGTKGYPEVVDYKTSSNPGRYAKTPEELRTDVQMVTYARVYLGLYPEHTGPVTVQHLYLTTKGAARVVPVEATLTRDDVAKAWATVEALAHEIDAKARAVEVLEGETPDVISQKIPESLFQKNPDACNAYGGCPHRQICFPGFDESNQHDPFPGVYMPPLSDLMNASKTETAPAAPVTETATVTTAPQVATETAAIPTGVLPPDAPAPQVEAPAKAKRGRKPKTETPAAAATAPGVEVVLYEPQATPDAPPTVEETAPLDLYVDCVPSFKGPQRGVAVTYLTDLIAKVAAEICAGQGVDDLDLIKYREGVGLLKAAFRRNPPTGVVVVSSGYYESEVLTVLEPLAWSVTRATKGGR